MKEEEVLLVKPPEDGQYYFSFHEKDGLLATRDEKPYDGLNPIMAISNPIQLEVIALSVFGVRIAKLLVEVWKLSSGDR